MIGYWPCSFVHVDGPRGGGARICGDVVPFYVLYRFVQTFILTCGIMVLLSTKWFTVFIMYRSIDQ